MTPTESSFLAAIDADPREEAPRLIYADWLDEQGSVDAAEFLRAELAVVDAMGDEANTHTARERLWQAWASIDRRRLHEFTQPRRMRANPTPWPAGWPMLSVADVLAHEGVATTSAFSDLPALPVSELLGDFRYLKLDKPSSRNLGDAWPTAMFQEAEAQLHGLGMACPSECKSLLALPWLPYMSRALLARRSRDGQQIFFTECPEFHPPQGRSQVIAEPNGCVRLQCFSTFDDYAWADPRAAIYLHPSGAHCVTWMEQADRPLFVAPSLEAFLYRVRIETHIFTAYQSRQNREPEYKEFFLTEPTPGELRNYVKHYTRREEVIFG